eukprot:scaffold2446_cov21-Tisochrysis_lutea.AAC.1
MLLTSLHHLPAPSLNEEVASIVFLRTLSRHILHYQDFSECVLGSPLHSLKRMQMSTSTTLTLLDLNKDCLGAIYSQLGTKEDRMSFFHSCKALHDTLKSKVYKLVLHVGEQGSAGEELSEQGSAEEQPLSVDDALRTFPGAVLRSIKLVGPIPREWLTLKGPLQHAAHVTELDVAQIYTDKCKQQPCREVMCDRLMPPFSMYCVSSSWQLLLGIAPTPAVKACP